MKERVIVSATTLVASLATYFYARHVQKDIIPYMMIGGFIGAFTGEIISHIINKDNDDNNPGASAAHA